MGEAGAAAIQKEMKQLHDMDVLKPVHKRILTRDALRKTLNYLMFLKRKRCGRIKGRGCADGRPQRVYIPRAETASPTVSLEALFITCMVDAYEERYVATVDIPGAFMQTKQPGIVHIRLTGAMVKLLAAVAPGVYDEGLVAECYSLAA